MAARVPPKYPHSTPFNPPFSSIVPCWQALRDIDDIHESWEQRVTPERRAEVQALGERRMEGLRYRTVAREGLLLALVVLLLAVLLTRWSYTDVTNLLV